MNSTNRRVRYAAVALSLGMMLPSTRAQDKAPSPSGAYVKPVDFRLLGKRLEALPKRDRELIDLYLESARRDVLTLEDGAFPNQGTEHWRNIAERAHGAAVLAAIPSDWPDDLRRRCRQEAAGFVKQFAAQFKMRRDLGNPWQCSWWVGEMGIAAWFVWDRLDPVSRNDVADMIIFHADRVAGETPGARVADDTEAETVAWNSTVLSLAANMMPTHPHNARWHEAAKRYVYTIFATSKDTQDHTPGDDGRPIKEWVVGANVHDDYSLENHGRFHVGYIFAAYRFMIQGAATYRVAGNPLPEAFGHHVVDVHDEILLRCISGSKFAVYVSDNDWRRYHPWAESPIVHGYVALLTSSSLASALEEQAIRRAAAYWEEFPEGFQYDNPYVCGKAWTPRMADIVLLHLLSPPLPEPMPGADVEARLSGVTRKQNINLLSHYSQTGSFRSVFWGPGPVVRHIESRENGWMLLPLESNYHARTDGKPMPDRGVDTRSGNGKDWFWVSRSYRHGGKESFISLPDDTVVMMNVVPSEKAETVDCLVATEKPHKTFVIHYRDATATYHYGRPRWERSDKAAGRHLKTPWVNLADSIGYVTVGLSQDDAVMVLPEPGVRSGLNLYHVKHPRDQHQRFIMVAMPNQTHQQTEAMATRITGSYADGVMTCRTPNCFVWANFSGQEVSVQAPEALRTQDSLTTPPNAVGILHRASGGEHWSELK